MKSYPSIPKDIISGQSVYAFDKLDGSNIRAEWSRKRGFYKFGTRTRLLGPDEPIFGQAIPIIRQKYEDALGKIARDERWQRCVFFFEFFGPSSFAGWHDDEDEFDAVLIDAAPYKKGFLKPRDFLKLFEPVEHAPLLYYGNINDELITSVQESTLDGMSFEGVVCKGANTRQGHGMFKIKSQAWLDALHTRCEGDDNLFDKLA